MELATLRDASPQRERSQSQGSGLLPQRQLQRDVPNSRELPIRWTESSQTANPLDEGSLHRGREIARKTSGSSRKISDPAKVSVAKNHLGRRGDVLLFQRKVETSFAGMVQPQPVSEPARKARTCRRNRSDDDSSVKLVQKSEAERSGVGGGLVSRQLFLLVFENLSRKLKANPLSSLPLYRHLLRASIAQW